MSKTIWKFPLEITDRQEVEMPQGACILSVQMNGGRPCLWALVDPEKPSEKFVLFIYGTGRPVDANGKAYVGTFQVRGMLEIYVWHVFVPVDYSCGSGH